MTYFDSLRPRSRGITLNLRLLYEKPVARVSTALLLTVFTITFFAFFAIRPTLSTIAQLLRKIEDQRSVKEKLDLKAASLSTAQADYLLIEPHLPLLETAIPATDNVGLLLKQIEGTASFTGIALQTMQVSAVDLTLAADTAATVPVTVSLTGTYPQVNDFLARLASMERVLGLEEIVLSEEDTDQISLRVTLVAYYLAD